MDLSSILEIDENNTGLETDAYSELLNRVTRKKTVLEDVVEPVDVPCDCDDLEESPPNPPIEMEDSGDTISEEESDPINSSETEEVIEDEIVEEAIVEENDDFYPTEAFSLSGVADNVELCEGPFRYKYQRIFTPLGTPTKKFVGFCKTNEEEDWTISRYMLTKNYRFFPFGAFINNLKRHIPIFSDTQIEYYPFYCKWSGTTTQEIENVFELDVYRLLFQAVGIITDEQLDNIKTRISIFSDTSHDGSKSVGIEYTITLSASVVGTNNLVGIIDYFSLCSIRQRRIHSGSELSAITLPEGIVATANQKISNLRGVTDERTLTRLTDGIIKSMRKPNKERFASYYGAMPQLNVYNAILCASMCLNVDYSYLEHVSLSKEISKVIKSI